MTDNIELVTHKQMKNSTDSEEILVIAEAKARRAYPDTDNWRNYAIGYIASMLAQQNEELNHG